MGKISKHTFEAVSLLTLNKGLIDVTIIPVQGELDWIVPSDLILTVIDLSEWIWTYQWQDYDVAVYHLIEKDSQPTKLVLLEGSSDVHRLGLQINGELIQKKVGISDVKDVRTTYKQSTSHERSHDFFVDNEIQYVFQNVMMDGKEYVVPDLDELAHRLVDLDN